MTDVKQFILDRLQREYSFKKDAEINRLNYVEEGYMDSLGLLQFIGELEDEFGIVFSDDELSSHEFQVVGSLIEIVEAKVEGK